MTRARASGASGDWAASRQTLRGAAGRREVRESTRYTPQTKIRKPSRAGLRPRRAHRRGSVAVRERGSGWGSDEEKLRQRPPAPLPGQRHPRGRQGRAGLSMRRAMLTGVRMARWRGNRLACRSPLAGRVRSAFHPMRAAAEESPGLPQCVDDRDQRRDRPGRSGERPELRRNVGTRLPWRRAPGMAPGLAARLGEVRRRWELWRLGVLLLLGR